jgi:hypothetical protein
MLVVRAMEDVSYTCLSSMLASDLRKRKKKRFGNGRMKMVEKAKGQNQLVSCLERQTGKSHLCDWIKATSVGLLGRGLRDLEAERLEKNDGWLRQPFI